MPALPLDRLPADAGEPFRVRSGALNAPPLVKRGDVERERVVVVVIVVVVVVAVVYSI